MATKKTEDKPVKSTKKVASTKESTAKKATATKEVTATKEAKAPKAPAVKRRPLLPKTFFAPDNQRANWHIIDAKGLTLGRMSSYIAVLLMGKHKPQYTRFIDTGDSVVVINANQVKLTGKKWDQKTYYHHTGFAGGIKSITAKEMLVKSPEKLIEKAVYRMLPKYKGHMTEKWFKKLFVYATDSHPHTAQKPQPVKLPNLGMGSN